MTPTPGIVPVRRALVSVHDKKDLLGFADALAELGVEFVATASTARTLRGAHIYVTNVSEVTGFPEIMGGRVKTLHPKIQGGILGRPGIDDAVMAEHGIEAFQLVVVNLYPFQRKADEGADFDECVENIDVGGFTMIRAAAKNHAYVTVVVDPQEYERVLREVKLQGGTTPQTRLALAYSAFTHTATYDSAVSQYLRERIFATRVAEEGEELIPPPEGDDEMSIF